MSRRTFDGNVRTNKNIKANYYLSNTGCFDEQFLSKIDQESLKSSIYLKKPKVIKKLSDYSNFPSFAFKISEMGPKEIFRDFKTLPYQNELNEDISSFIQNLGISMMVGLARGHTYNEGVFEMPSNIPDHRVMAICFRYKDMTVNEDPRLTNSYLQIAIFIPRDVLQYLPCFSSLEDRIMEIVKLHIYDEKISMINISSLKYNILNLISEIIIDQFQSKSHFIQ